MGTICAKEDNASDFSVKKHKESKINSFMGTDSCNSRWTVDRKSQLNQIISYPNCSQYWATLK